VEPEVLKMLLVQEDQVVQTELDLLGDYMAEEEVPVMTILQQQVVPVLKV
jgi:alpha-ketoglutarate-dependent taurine dioxygenase